MANFIRAAGILAFLVLIAVGFFNVHEDRTNEAVSTLELLIRGWVPVIVGFVLAWGALEIGDRVDSRPCPRCGNRVKFGSYRCPTCGYDFARTTVPAQD